MAKSGKQLPPMLPRPGKTSVTPEQAHQAKEHRRSIRHGKKSGKKSGKKK